LSDAAFDKAVLYRDERFSERGGLPWCRAAWAGDTVSLRAMLDADVPTLKPDIDGDLAIHCAVRAGNHDAVTMLLDADSPITPIMGDEAGRTALDLAAAQGDVDLIDLVVAADPDWHLDTALLAALRAGHVRAAAHLIALGAPVDGALDAAIAADRPEAIRCLAEHGIPMDGHALYQAVGQRSFAGASTLIDLGADTNFADETGTTVLHLAADRGATAMCMRLLDAGASVDARLQTFGAVHFALLGGHAETALALIDRGADVTGTDQPLIGMALRGGSAPLVQWCLDRGEAVPPEAVATAVLGDHADVLRTLIAAGAPVSIANTAGVTPLHLAADRGYAGCVELLLEAGAPVDVLVPGQDATALDLARLQGHEECVRLLELAS
jgi:ankyrin repeat protein